VQSVTVLADEPLCNSVDADFLIPWWHDKPSAFDPSYYQASAEPWAKDLFECLDTLWVRYKQRDHDIEHECIDALQQVFRADCRDRSKAAQIERSLKYQRLGDWFDVSRQTEQPAAEEVREQNPVDRRAPNNVFASEGPVWTISFGGVSEEPFVDRKGLQLIATLLQHPDRSIPVEDLEVRAYGRNPHLGNEHELDRDELQVGRESGGGLRSLDRRTERTIDGALEDLRCQLEETADLSLREDTEEKIQKLQDYKRQNIGLRGRIRMSSDRIEKARKRVRENIENCTKEMKNPLLQRHLRNSIKYGREVRYSPESDIEWEL
jgi:hypothetical protein